MEIVSNLKVNHAVVVFLENEVVEFLSDMIFLKTDPKKLKLFFKILFKPAQHIKAFHSTGFASSVLFKGAVFFLVSFYNTMEPYLKEDHTKELYEGTQNVISTILTSYKNSTSNNLERYVENGCLVMKLVMVDYNVTLNHENQDIVDTYHSLKSTVLDSRVVLEQADIIAMRKQIDRVFSGQVKISVDSTLNEEKNPELKMLGNYFKKHLNDKNLTLYKKVLSATNPVINRIRSDHVTQPVVKTLFLHAAFPNFQTNIVQQLLGTIDRIRNSNKTVSILNQVNLLSQQSIKYKHQVTNQGSVNMLDNIQSLLSLLFEKTFQTSIINEIAVKGGSILIPAMLLRYMGSEVPSFQTDPEALRVQQETDLLFVGIGIAIPELAKLFYTFYKNVAKHIFKDKRSKKKIFNSFFDCFFTAYQLAFAGSCLLALLACDASTNKCAFRHEWFVEIHMRVSYYLSITHLAKELIDFMSDLNFRKLFTKQVGSNAFNILFINFIEQQVSMNEGRFLFYVFFIGLQSAVSIITAETEVVDTKGSNYMIIDRMSWSINELYNMCRRKRKDTNQMVVAHRDERVRSQNEFRKRYLQLNQPPTNATHHTHKQQNQQRRNSNVND